MKLVLHVYPDRGSYLYVHEASHTYMYTINHTHVLHVLSVWDEQKLFKSINTKYQVLRKIGKISELEKFSSL